MAKKKGALAKLFAGIRKSSKKSRNTGKRKSNPTKARSSASKGKAKTPSKKSTGRCCCRSSVRKIFETIDGFFTQNPKISKRRRVAVIKQRKDDGALAVVKIYSQDEKKTGQQYINGMVLSPKKHKSLTKDSIVGSKAIVGTKSKDGKFAPIYKSDLTPTGDKLTRKEHHTIMENLGGGNPQHKQTNENLLDKWDKHFKE